MSSHFSCDSFAQIDWFNYQQNLQQAVRQEVQALSKDYILGVDENTYKSFLIERYSLQPLEVFTDSEHITPRTEKQSFQDDFGRTGYREIYLFQVRYNFGGSAELFQIKSNPWKMTSHPISVDSDTVTFELKMARKDPDEFKRKKDESFRESFANVENINKNAAEWNQSLPQWVNSIFDGRKKHFAAENDFFAAINVAPDPRTSEIFTAPTIKRQVVPRPNVSPKKQFSRVPTMSDEMYEDVLKVLSQAGCGMERKPSLYRGKEEEDVRDQFLLFLETRYAATTGTSETFNKAGKTDILLKYEDGTNLFVAECKWWSGETEFHAAIKQLFDRYLTWRDSKAALLLFVRNKNFSAVINKVRSEAAKSPYFIGPAADRGETSLAFDFHLSSDEQRLVRFAILLFSFP
jgi:hypothetical protein